MTRLVEKDVRNIRRTLKDYDDLFQRQTGRRMYEVARRAAGFEEFSGKYRVAVVPSTTGMGIISGFSEAVCGILRYCSADAFVTGRCDVDGIYEALLKEADMIFTADDDRFLAFGAALHAVADNGICTGEGFAEALLCSMRMPDRRVLVLGASNVGQAAAQYLIKRGAAVDLYDTNAEVLDRAEIPGSMARKLYAPPVLKNYRYLYDATTSGDFITEEDVTPDTVVAAPGMPRGVTGRACEIATVIHNPLELGVLTMYYACARQIYAEKREKNQ